MCLTFVGGMISWSIGLGGIRGDGGGFDRGVGAVWTDICRVGGLDDLFGV